MNSRLRGALWPLALSAAAALAVLSQAGCGGTSAPPTPPVTIAPPAALGYQLNPAVYHLGMAIADNPPHGTGGAVDAYAVSPALPAGLLLDAATGVVSGTPSAITPQATYTVTATNAGGAATAALFLTVTDAPPDHLAYTSPSAVHSKGVAIAANHPTSHGGAVARYAVAPALPAGLSLDAASGVLSGTPTAVVARFTYTVTASNAGGSATAPVEITVDDTAPGGLAYASNPATYTLNGQIPPNVPSSSGGALTAYWVSPALPAGLLLDAGTGVLTGTPLVTTEGTYRVTARNSGGSVACDLTIKVIAAPPTGLSYAVNPLVATKGLALTPDAPSSAGGPVVSYSVSPTLPAGLVLDSTTGVVSGTPTALTPAAAYLVTATNTGGSATASLSIAVQDQAPAALVYATNPSSYSVATAIQPNQPSNTGGFISNYSISPALPAGLQLDAGSGVISGTPTALAAQANYVVTGANATGSTTCTLVTSVVAAPIAPPVTPVVTAPLYATAGKAGYQASTQDQGSADGMGYLWTVTNGTLTAGQGTRAITFTAGAVGPLLVQVKAQNLGGSASGTAQVSVEAVPTAPLFAQDQVLYGSTGVLASVPPQSRMTYQWTLSGPSAGALAGATNTNVATYSVGPQPGAYQLSVTVQNRAGDQAKAARTLAAVSRAFLPDPRTAPQRQQHTVTTLLDGRVLVAGGMDESWVTASAVLYDPYTGTWTQVGPLAAGRANPTATLLLDGRVLVAGGEGSDGNLTPLASTELYDPETRTWSAGGDMTTVRQDHAATRLQGGMVLVSGGVPILTDTSYAFLDSSEVYDPASNSWSPAGTLSLRRAGHTSTLLPDGRVVLVGGYSQQGSVGWQRTTDLFNPKTYSWSAGANMTGSRSGHTANLLASGKVLVTGGNGSAPAASAVLFDSTTNGGAGSWTPAGSLAAGRYLHRSVLLATGKVLVVSGRDGGSSGKELTSTELYDPATSSWSSAGALGFSAYAHAAALLLDGRVLAFGGVNSSSQFVHSENQLYDPALNAWTNAGGMATPRSSHTTTTLPSGVLLVAGGTGTRGSLSATELFDPAGAGWSVTGALITPRTQHTATLLGSGKVLVSGGWGGTGDLASAELYNPATGAWEAGPVMAVVRSEHTATLLADGRVLVAGGWTSSSTVGATSALYDPATGGWVAAGDLGAPRVGHQAVLLASGKVLVTGGRNSTGYLAAAELFDPVTKTWSAAAPMNSAREHHTLNLLPDGRAIAIGGQNNASLFTATVESYDPGTNGWTVLAPMSDVRAGHAVTVLSDQTLLVTGGDGGPYGPALRTSERFDPVAGTWTTLSALTSTRSFHTATSLGAAGVLVIGGDPGSTPEVWKP